MTTPIHLLSAQAISANGSSQYLNGSATQSGASVVTLSLPYAQSVIAAQVAVAAITGTTGLGGAGGLVVHWVTTPYTIVNTSVIAQCQQHKSFEIPITQGMSGTTTYWASPVFVCNGVNLWYWVDAAKIQSTVTLDLYMVPLAVPTATFS